MKLRLLFTLATYLIVLSSETKAETLDNLQKSFDIATPVSSGSEIEGNWECYLAEGTYERVTTHGSCHFTSSRNVSFQKQDEGTLGSFSVFKNYSDGLFTLNAVNDNRQMIGELNYSNTWSSENINYKANLRIESNGDLIIFLQHPTLVSTDEITYYGPFIQCKSLKTPIRRQGCIIL